MTRSHRMRSLLGLAAIGLAWSPSVRAVADDAGSGSAVSTCTESLPAGVERPTLVERLVTANGIDASGRGKAGDLIQLEIAVHHAAGETATLPSDLPSHLSKGEVRMADDGSWGRGAPPKSSPDPADPTHATTILHVPLVVLSTTLARKAFVVPPIRVVVLRKGGGDLSVCTRERTVDIDQPIANSPDPQPRPPPPPMPQVTRNERLQTFVLDALATLALGGLAGALYIWWRRRPKIAPPPPPPPPPWKTAFAAISAARADFVAARIPSKMYYDRLSDVVRDYLGQVLSFEGLELTTDELLSRLRMFPSPSVPYEAIARFLGECDLVKFANYSPPSDAGSESAEQAERIVGAMSPRGRGDASFAVASRDRELIGGTPPGPQGTVTASVPVPVDLSHLDERQLPADAPGETKVAIAEAPGTSVRATSSWDEGHDGNRGSKP